MAMKQDVLLCEKNMYYKRATTEYAGTNMNIGQIKNEKFRILPNEELRIYTDHPVPLGAWGQGGNDVLEMYLQKTCNAYTILVTTNYNHIKRSSKEWFGLISSTHTIPTHTVRGLDNVLYNTLTAYFNVTLQPWKTGH